MGVDLDDIGEKSAPQLVEAALPLSRKLKLVTAVAIFYGNIMFGCGYNVYGPVLTSMQNKYETDSESISRALTVLTVSYMIGALTGGIIFNYVNRQLSVIVIFGVMGAVMILTPHCPTIILFFVSCAVMGLCCGAYDAAQFVWMMEMMQKDCPPYVQAQHFFYAIGTILASSIMAPFLDEEETTTSTSTTTSSTKAYQFNYNDFGNESTIMGPLKKSEEDSKSDKLFIPFTIIGCLLLLAMAYHILLFVFLRYRPPPPEASQGVEGKPSESDKQAMAGFKPWSCPKIRIVLLCCCFYGAYQGMEMCTFQFFPKFGQNSNMNLTEAESTYVLTGMNAAFAAGRAVAIIIVFKISVQLILCANIVIVVVANVLLIGWAKYSLSMLWASSILFGIGFSSMFASFSAYIERYLIFTNTIGSLMIVCGAGLASLYPLIVGKYIDDNPVVLSYTTFFSLALVVFAVSVSSYITYKDKTRH